jgi:glycosyltransferase involved in cell wall biosynthesis
MIKTVKDVRIEPNTKFITFVGPELDSCTDKIIGEYNDFFIEKGYTVLFTKQAGAQDAMNYAPTYLVLFRAGSRPCDSQEIQKLANIVAQCRAFGIRVVYYMDDFLWTANNGAPLSLAANCDAIITATPAIKEYAIQAQISRPVILVPTHIDIPTIDKLQYFKEVKDLPYYKVLISSGGRVGATLLHSIVSIMNDDPDTYKDVLLIINSSGVAQMRTLVNQFRNVNKMYIDWLGLTDYYRLTKSVDLILAPASPGDLAYFVPDDLQNIWLDSKSEVKYTVAGAAGIPIISSPTQSYSKAITHGENGMIANTAEEFVLYMSALKDDAVYTKKLVEAARKDCEENYHVAVRFPEFLAAITGDFTGTKMLSGMSKYIYAPPLAGGPRTFFTTMERSIREISSGEWCITDSMFKGLKGAIIVAFYGLQEAQTLKKQDLDFKIITRVDGLPMNFEGGINNDHLGMMVLSMKLADEVVWQSQHCRDIWAPILGEGAKDLLEKGRIIHNGVDTSIFHEEGDKFILPVKDKINILHVNFSTFKHKRIDILLDIIKEAPPEVQFILVGQYLDTGVQNDIKMFQPFNNVTFLGPSISYNREGREFLASVYRSCDAFLFTSEMEGSPNSLLEAASCGLPIIYNSSNSVVPEILGEYCMPIGEATEFIDKLNLLKAIGFIEGMQIGMRERMKEFTAEKMAEKYLQIFKEVL